MIFSEETLNFLPAEFQPKKPAQLAKPKKRQRENILSDLPFFDANEREANATEQLSLFS